MGKRANSLIIAAAAVLASVAPAAAQSSRFDELRAAFIYNFARFTEWPPNAFDGPGAPIVACVAQNNPIAPALGAIDGKAVAERALHVRRRDEYAGFCHIEVVSEDDSEAAAVLEASTGPVLTVGEGDAFAARGGTVGLIQVGRQVRFVINVGAVDRAGLTMSSKLLRLAVRIER